MATTKNEIRGWLAEGKKRNATHVLVICDSFDYEDYPVYVMPNENVHEVIGRTCQVNNMQRLMEVYNLSKDIDTQLNEHRAANY